MSWLKSVSSSGEDVFDEDLDDFSLQNKEWKYNMKKRVKDGFRDGIDAGKEVSLQVGFNLGYRDGVAKMNTIGQLKGIVSALQCWCQSQRPGSPALASVTELLHGVVQHEEALVEAMRKAQECPPLPSVSEVSEDLEDLEVVQGEGFGETECCKKGGEADCSGKGCDADCCSKDKDADRGPLRCSSQSSFSTGDSLEQLLERCIDLVTELGLPEELKHHLQQLKNT